MGAAEIGSKVAGAIVIGSEDGAAVTGSGVGIGVGFSLEVIDGANDDTTEGDCVMEVSIAAAFGEAVASVVSNSLAPIPTQTTLHPPQ